MRVTRFNKAIVSGLAAILDVLMVAMGDNVLDMTEKQHIVTTLVTVAIGVYAVWRVPNAKDTPEDNSGNAAS